MNPKDRAEVEALYQHFCLETQRLGFPGSFATRPRSYQYEQSRDIIRHLGLDRAKAVITFAIQHWVEYRDESRFWERLHVYPNFNQMLPEWHYSKWLSNMMEEDLLESEFGKNRDETTYGLSKEALHQAVLLFYVSTNEELVASGLEPFPTLIDRKDYRIIEAALLGHGVEAAKKKMKGHVAVLGRDKHNPKSEFRNSPCQFEFLLLGMD
ncbi:hypothetical protein WDW37_18155 [Bdellovibrionota bacterium FG-1]